MRKSVGVPVVLLALAGLFGACGGGNEGAGAIGANEITKVNGQRFDPETLTVSAGDTVTFVNRSSETHTVTAYEDKLPEGAAYFASGGFTSEAEAVDNLSDGLVDPDETFEVTLAEPGTYAFYCIPHAGAGMTGRIVVGG